MPVGRLWMRSQGNESGVALRILRRVRRFVLRGCSALGDWNVDESSWWLECIYSKLNSYFSRFLWLLREFFSIVDLVQLFSNLLCFFIVGIIMTTALF